ncbi:MAG: universal stress protein [Syntrophales bacterium]|mgnify:FL=1|nr:universal stress protein [Syntrophales bacterium]
MYKKILVPLDGSELAECALPHVINLVQDGSVGEVTVLNVYKVDLSPVGAKGYAQGINVNQIKKSMFTASANYLTDVESRLGSKGIKVKTVSLEGARPAVTISDYAKENGIDMIVIATHGYTGLKKLMLGSVALGVLQESHVPVLLIRPDSCRI